MNKQKFFMGTVLILACLIFSSCGLLKKTDEQSKESAYEQIHKKLLGLETYKSEAIVKYISNKGETEYDTLQHCKISGEYRIEVVGPLNVSGNVTLFDGKMIGQYNPKIGAKVTVSQKETQDRSELFITSFIKNYMNSQEVSVSASKVEDSSCTVLEAVIPGGHPYLTTEKLWVDNETKMPVKLVVYDPEGSERIVVTYKTFEYNVKLEDSLFVVQ